MKLSAPFLALLALCYPVSAQQPTIEELEANPDYTRIESVTLAGECQSNTMLAGMMKSRDAVKKVHESRCDHIIYSKPGDSAETRAKGYLALAREKKGGTVFFKGTWDEEGYLEMEFSEVSFDQKTWFPVSKGRLRSYQSPEETLMMIFAVFEAPRKGGKTRNEGVAITFLPKGKS